MRREPSSLGILGGPSAIGLYSASDIATGFAKDDLEKDINATTTFFNSQTPPNAKAAQIKDDYSKWVNGVSWWDKVYSPNDVATKLHNFKYDYSVAVDPTYGSQQSIAQREQYGAKAASDIGDRQVAAQTTSGRVAEAPKAGLPWKWILLGTGVAAILVFAYAAPKALVGGAFSRKPKALAANPGKRRKARR